MAAPDPKPPYTLRNNTRDTFLYSASHDENFIQQFEIKGGHYIVFNKSPVENLFLHDEASLRMISDIFKSVGSDFTLTDSEGNEVTSEKFRQDNP